MGVIIKKKKQSQLRFLFLGNKNQNWLVLQFISDQLSLPASDLVLIE